jgi:hypothetical protein
MKFSEKNIRISTNDTKNAGDEQEEQEDHCRREPLPLAVDGTDLAGGEGQDDRGNLPSRPEDDIKCCRSDHALDDRLPVEGELVLEDRALAYGDCSQDGRRDGYLDPEARPPREK